MADLAVFDEFLRHFNGTVFFRSEVVSMENLELFTDAAGSTGFGAYFGGRWCAARWRNAWFSDPIIRNLAFLELFPLVVSLMLLGKHLKDRKVIFFMDNMAPVVCLLRHFVLLCMSRNIFFQARQVPGFLNGVAESLSCFQWPTAMAFWFKWHFGLVAWIIGQFLVFWDKRRAAARPDGQQLACSRAHLEVKWFGYRGYDWGDVFDKLIHLLNRGRRPDVVIFHAGGNDLGLFPQRVLVRTMKQDINRLRDWLPGVAVVWAEIVPRFQWRHARDQVALGKSRIKINRLMSAFVRKVGGVVVRHRELEAQLPGYYRAEGVHLSDVGLDFLNMGFQVGLERALVMAEPSQLKVSRTGFVAGV
ncbi:uncharacterized protein RCH25_025452 [Pelodytes ibericus]